MLAAVQSMELMLQPPLLLFQMRYIIIFMSCTVDSKSYHVINQLTNPCVHFVQSSDIISELMALSQSLNIKSPVKAPSRYNHTLLSLYTLEIHKIFPIIIMSS